MRDDVVSRRVGLHGHDAVDWLEERGWLLADTAGNVMVIADEMHLPSVTVRRVAHSPLTMERQRSAGEPDGILMLVLEGRLSLTVDEVSSGLLGSGSTLTFLTTQPLAMSSSVPVQWLQIEGRSLGDVGSPRWWGGGTRRSTFDLVALAASGVLNSTDGYRTDAAAFVDQAVEATALAHTRSVDAVARAEAGTYVRARATLVAYAHSPGFSVARWAERVGVTREHLARLTRAHGVTPGSLLRARRAAVARRTRLLRPDLDDDAVAEASGFRSARAMNEALRRSSEKQTP